MQRYNYHFDTNAGHQPTPVPAVGTPVPMYEQVQATGNAVAGNFVANPVRPRNRSLMHPQYAELRTTNAHVFQ